MEIITAGETGSVCLPVFVKMGVSGKRKPSKPVRRGDVERLTVRAISPGGVPLGRVMMAQAHFYIREGLAKGIGGRGKREFVTLQMVHAQVESRVPGGDRYTYNEDLGDHRHVMTLKRAVPGGGYKTWHPDLTFTDLRLGRMKPAKVAGRGFR